MVHTGKKLFNINFARKPSEEKDYIAHVWSHDGRFKLKCTLCPKKFTLIWVLESHCDKFHEGEGHQRKRVYEDKSVIHCTLCESKFTSSRSGHGRLKRHCDEFHSGQGFFGYVNK